ncbi:unnamed protein product [Psylliodes chrysocephalus]|uniref:C2H2-type domain-containing protein n=1 Tax=Psylliodes chrysocephalus TaxID=3402493 RepID=A0A9P0GCV8_9CUCU|nr:unnamed protein product [Psylliodes chrysocephala]
MIVLSHSYFCLKIFLEIKEMKAYTEELETHISSSSSRNTPVVSFKCDICSKLFSSEDYLNSHLKKRHNGAQNKIGGNSEAEKLHSEIKELKERLNNTEKFIQEKPTEKEIDTYKSHFKEIDKDSDDKTTKLVSEIQDSFEKFRKQVEEKMGSLQSEKNFFTEKYDKLFEIVLQYKNREHEIVKIDESKPIEIPKIENTTQTSVDEYHSKKEKTKNLQIYTVQHENVFDATKKIKDADDREENIDEKIERKLSNFEENIESKISIGLGHIEDQIQAFWEKLSEVELNQTKIGDHIQSTDATVRHTTSDSSPQNKPKIKPRTKLTKQTTHAPEKGSNAEIVKQELDKILAMKSDSTSKPEIGKVQVKLESNSEFKPAVVKSAVSKMYESTTEDDLSIEEDTDSSEDFDEDKPKRVDDAVNGGITLVKKKNSPVHLKSSATDSKVSPKKPIKFEVNSSKPKSSILKNVSSIKGDVKISEKNIRTMRNQLNDLIDVSLQEMGINPHWRGIPKKTFERALDIVNHQACLNKKCLPNYDSIKKSIEQSLNSSKELKKLKQKGQPTVTRDSPNRKKSKRNVVRLQIRKHLPEETGLKPDSAVTIKNRSLYDTESETDIKTYLPKNFDQKKVHSAVIEELQSKFSENRPQQDTDSDLNSVVLFDREDKAETREKDDTKETKSALKNVAGDGGGVKKKVLFDVEDSDKNDIRKNEVEDRKDGGDNSFSDFEITE